MQGGAPAGQPHLNRLAQAAVYDRHLLVSVASGSLLGLLMRTAAHLANTTRGHEYQAGLRGRAGSLADHACHA